MKILRFVIRIISIFIIVFCSIQILIWVKDNNSNQKLQSLLLNKINTKVDLETEQNTKITNIDFSEIISINPNTVAWIQVPGTDINYSIVQAKDNEFYLTHSFDNSYNSAGWIFADYRNKFDNTDQNIVIYGHNRRNGTMFSTLKNTLRENWYTNENNLIINFYQPNTSNKYKVFSVYQIPVNELNLPLTFDSNDDYINYLNEIKNKSIYDFKESIEKTDRIITLYTCTDNNLGRIILHAKLIK